MTIRILLSVLLSLFILSANAKWKPEYASSDITIQRWYSEQRNSLGQFCCSEADGHSYEGNYSINKDGSVSIGTKVIPKEKVLTNPNPTGHAVWWYVEEYGNHIDYCFSPGPLT